jgi:pimeloyl-ACP methyl ester carboxylesterase
MRRFESWIFYALMFLITGWFPIAHPQSREELARLYRPRDPDLGITKAIYERGRIIKLTISGRVAYLVLPNGPADSQRRWVWIAPCSLGVLDKNGNGRGTYRYYVESLLARGFHVGGVDVGITCGGLPAEKVCERFYETVNRKYKLNHRVRLIGQSNGGLIAYAWAFRHPRSVDRIVGIYPVTDMRTWPGLNKVCGRDSFPEATAPELAYHMTVPELENRLKEFNPIHNLEPRAKANVRIFHLHGDSEHLVPMGPNSEEVVRRYQALGGKAELEVLHRRGHGPTGGPQYSDEIFYNCKRVVEFLLEYQESNHRHKALLVLRRTPKGML